MGLVLLFAFACLSFILPPLSRHFDYDLTMISYLSGRITKTEYLSEFDGQDVVETADFIATHTAQETPIFIWGHYAMIYYLADRPNPTRFNVDPPLSLPHRQQEIWRQETAEDLAANPPAYIVVATDDTTQFESQSSKEQLPNYPALTSFMAAYYQLETTIGSFELYRYTKS